MKYEITIIAVIGFLIFGVFGGTLYLASNVDQSDRIKYLEKRTADFLLICGEMKVGESTCIALEKVKR